MDKQLFENLKGITEQQRGQEYTLKVPLDSDAAKRLSVRVDDPKNYPVGTTLYFMGEEYDEDGFWWVDFVTDKNLLNATSYGSRDPGVIRFTPTSFNQIFSIVKGKEEVEGQIDEVRSPVYTQEILQKISNIADLNRLDSWLVADGSVALFRYERDGNAYEVEVRPISQGKSKELWGDKIKKKEDRNNRR